MSMSSFARFQYCGFIRRRIAVTDVVKDGAPKEDRFLGDERNLSVPTLKGHMAQVFAVDRDATFRRIVEAMKQVDHGGLAGARRSDECDQFAWLGLERQVRQHRMASIIAEVDVFHPHMSIDGHKCLCIGLITNVRLSIQYFEDPLRRSLGLFDLRKNTGCRAEGTDQDAGEQDEGEQIARRDDPVDDLRPPYHSTAVADENVRRLITGMKTAMIAARRSVR